MNTQQTIDTIHTNLFQFGANMKKMDVLEMYEYLKYSNNLSQLTFTELKKLFKLNMMDQFYCYTEPIDLGDEFDLVNLCIYKDMFDWLFSQYSSIVIECNNNRKEALTRLCNKFVDICKLWLDIELTYSFAVHVIQNVMFGYHYKRKHHYYPTLNGNFEFMYEVVVRA